MGDTGRIAKNTVFLYLRSLIVLLISLYTSRVVLQVLGVVDYGIYCVVGGVIGLLAILTQTMHATYQRFYNVEMGKKNTEGVIRMFQLSLTTQLLLAVIVVLLGETIGLWFVVNKLVIPENRLTAAIWVYQASIITFVINIFTAPFGGTIVAYEKMGFTAVVSIIDAVLRLGIVFLIRVLPGDSLIIYSYLLMSVAFTNILLYYLYCKRNIPTTKVKFIWNKAELKSMVSFSGWTLLGEIGNVIKTQGINIILNLFFGPVVNAARGVAAQVLNAVNQFINSFQTSFRPQLTKSYASGDYDYLKKLYYSSTKFSYYLLFTLSLPIILEISFILRIWLGNTVPENTAVFTRLVLLTAFVSAFANPTSCIIYATGKIKWFSIIVGTGNVLILPIAWMLLEFGYGPVSTLVVSLIMTALIQLARLVIISKISVLGLSEYVKCVGLPTILFSTVAPLLPLMIHFSLSQGFLRFLIVGFVSVLTCILSAWFIGLNKPEKMFIKTKIDSIIKRKC